MALGLRSMILIFIMLIFTSILVATVPVQDRSSNGMSIDVLSNSESYFVCKKVLNSVCDRVPNAVTGDSYSSKAKEILQVNAQPSYVDGPKSKALELDAKRMESVLIPDNPAVNPINFSVSISLKTSRTSQPDGQVISHIDRQGTAGWYFDILSNGTSSNYARFRISSTDGNFTSSKEIAIESDKFVNIAATFDGSTLSVYKNGQIVDKTHYYGSFWPYPLVPLSIGAASYSPTQLGWSGIIDEILLYNTSLSDTEMNNIFIAQGHDSNNLVGKWSFDGNLLDSSPDHSSGKLVTLVSSMAFSPDGKLFFSKKNTGQIMILHNDQDTPKTFVTIPDVYVSWEQGLLGITIDPKYEQNKFIYAYYTMNDNGEGQIFNRVVRFTDANGTGTDMKIILDKIPASSGYHSGGALAFGPDDKLYVTVGDATEHIFSQDPSIFIGKILRINRDGTIPVDNPFPGSPVYTLGHRNMYGIAFDKKDGIGIVTENGDIFYDEINYIKKGGNYGFPIFQLPNTDPLLANNTSIKPIRSYRFTLGPTQAIYYEMSKFPELTNKFLFGTFTGYIYALKINKTTMHLTEEDLVNLRFYPFDPVIAISQSPDGEIYFAGYSIYRFESLTKEGTHIYPIKIQKTENVSIEDVKFNNDTQQLSIQIGPQSSIPMTMNIKVPKLLLNVSSVDLGLSNGSISTVTPDTNSTKFLIDRSDKDYLSLKLILDHRPNTVNVNGARNQTTLS